MVLCIFGVKKEKNFSLNAVIIQPITQLVCDGVGIDVLAWCGVLGETGRLFGQHVVPTGFKEHMLTNAAALIGDNFISSRTMRQFTCLDQQDNGYASMTSHC